MHAPAATHESVPARQHQMSANPRRRSASLSKSLPPSKKQKLSHIRDGQAEPDSLPAPGLPTGESQGSGSDQSASRWFDQVNKNVPQGHDGSQEPDDEPPFFISKQDGYTSDRSQSSDADDSYGTLHHNDSENADLRGVIDDLTIENRRLKQILKEQRSRANPVSEGKDKMFEVRLHGLPTAKKRELEQLLKNFATNIHTGSRSTAVATAAHASHSTSVEPSSVRSHAGLPHKRVHTDSGYTSNSNSGLTSNSNEGNPSPAISKSTRNKNIKNYLHDIPDTLLPRHSPMMSQKAKMVLVVQRLEQLFTGKQESSSDHTQPIRQQEVAYSAATADRNEDAKLNRKSTIEGSREARMLPHDTKVNLDSIDRQEQSPLPKSERSQVSSEALQPLAADAMAACTTSDSCSPDQRPTRPLDLDIHRAQLADENIEYIRHLGMSPRVNKSADPQEPSWIYLNLLIGMAQLHTLNVTPAFVRRAVKKMSSKFELSKDGHQVRWRGGTQGTAFSNDVELAVEAAQQIQSEPVDFSGSSSCTRSKTNSSSNPLASKSMSEDKMIGGQPGRPLPQHVSTTTESNEKSSMPTMQSKTSSAFEYKPIVYTAKRYKAADSYLDSTSSYASTSGDSSGLVHAMNRSNLNHSRTAGEGTMTFFNSPFFYSDVSADNAPTNWHSGRREMSQVPIGMEYEVDLEESPLRHHDACYFVPQFAPKPYQPRADEPTISFSPETITAAGEEETCPPELPVSGIGGVVPEENFALDVKVERKINRSQPAPQSRRVPLTGTHKTLRYSYRSKYCRRLDLLPSALPPPSYVFFTSSSSSANMEDDTSSSSDGSSSADEEHPAPPAFLHHWSTGTSSDGDADDYEGESSSDMLQAARAIDPDWVAAEERQYAINQPGGGGRIEGSVAATIGSRSTTSDMDQEIASDEDEIGSDTDMDD